MPELETTPLVDDARLLALMTAPASDVTALLDAWSEGDASALVELMDVAQKELHRIASRLFEDERADHTLQPTAVVNELYLKLKGQRQVEWHSRAEFFAVAARLMRRVLVDHARRHHALKRGGGTVRVALDENLGFPSELAPRLTALDDALSSLARRSPRQSRWIRAARSAAFTAPCPPTCGAPRRTVQAARTRPADGLYIFRVSCTFWAVSCTFWE